MFAMFDKGSAAILNLRVHRFDGSPPFLKFLQSFQFLHEIPRASRSFFTCLFPRSDRWGLDPSTFWVPTWWLRHINAEKWTGTNICTMNMVVMDAIAYGWLCRKRLVCHFGMIRDDFRSV